jgi:hypothetical protein
MSKFNFGKSLKEEDFLVELEKMEQINHHKAVVKLDKTTPIDEIFNTLEKVDEVKIKLNDYTELRISHNNKYYVNDCLFGFNANDEWGTKYDGDLARKTVAYTGEQKFRRYISFLLENLE